MARNKVFDESAVLGKATKLFWEKGYHGTSAQDLVDHLGISRSSLYDTFGDKRSLMLKTLEAYRSQGASMMIQLLQESSSPLKAIKQILKSTAKESLEEPHSPGCYMVNMATEMAAHDEEVADIINQNFKDVEDVLAKAIRRGQDAGEISKAQSPRALARLLQNTINGIRVTARTKADKAFCDDVVKVTLSVLEA